ncbi:MAG: hypothetical protein IIA02_08345 [Proteobacteria bacterium]|nr:hypothetical protein [Pseudomonadota bacterium]
MSNVKTKDILPQVLASLKRLAATDVLVGIPAQSPERSDGEPINNAALGYIHETGAPAAGIPARPFLVPGVAAAGAPMALQLKKAAQAAIVGNPRAVDQRLHAAGLVAETSVKNTINVGVEPALADSTIAARERRGRTGTVPLIDTGSLRNSVTHVVRRK